METYFEIIEVIGAGTQKPTHIMYKANLSWSVMQDYIRKLEGKEIIAPKVVDGRKIYQLTQKGFALLEKYLEIKEGMTIGEGLPQSIVAS